ncbi:minor tail protein [Mycobacterium phage BuzzBuzz]|nr:minor tail protein [Mycobacterium phage BuzzBuzz]AXH47927.1 minor tail protein [Mycobacterium phage Misomonster]UAJ16540.1 minor tail protein [Mycobacterium phage LarryKay]
MTPGFDPTDWVDLVAYAILTIPATIGAVAAWRSHQKVKQTHYEITNDHDSNIRHDIDDLAEAVREGFREIRKDIGGLREELRTERIERIEGDRLRVVRDCL